MIYSLSVLHFPQVLRRFDGLVYPSCHSIRSRIRASQQISRVTCTLVLKNNSFAVLGVPEPCTRLQPGVERPQTLDGYRAGRTLEEAVTEAYVATYGQ